MLGTFFVRRIGRCSISIHRDSEVARSSVSKLLPSRLTIRARWKAGRLRGGLASTMSTTSIAASLEDRTQSSHRLACNSMIWSQGVVHSGAIDVAP